MHWLHDLSHGAHAIARRLGAGPLACVFILALACGGAARAQIVAFGASNVSGWNVAAAQAFPAQLQSMLRAKGYEVRVVNAGVYGDTTAGMLARIDAAIPDGARIVVLDTTGGLHNDLLKGVSRAQGEADMAAIAARLKARDIAIVPFSGADLPARYHQSDGVHLNAEGHALAASQLLPQVMALLGPPSPPTPTAVIDACRADARRLCQQALGDAAERHACMHDHRAELSKDCISAIARSRRDAP